MLNIRKIQNPE